MNFLEERILRDGIVKEGNVLKVDSFLNHQMDIELLDQMGKEFYERFKELPITKVFRWFSQINIEPLLGEYDRSYFQELLDDWKI